MDFFIDKLQTAYKEGLRKKFTEPKIYHGGENFDLSKRWYVYYSFVHPIEKDSKGNPILKRQTPITLKVNQQFKTKKDRLFHLQLIQEALLQMLKDGYSPYEQKGKEKDSLFTAKSALEFAFELKKGILSESSLRDYKSRIKRFKDYLEEQNLLELPIQSITKKVVLEYLNTIQKNSSARNRNNTKIVLSSLFSVLEENDIIPKNFIHGIKKLNTKPKRNKTYSLELVEDIYNFLEKENPQMLFFIKMVSFNFLRPIEVCRLRMNDINIKEKELTVKAKNKVLKTKSIPKLLVKELEVLDFSDKNAFLVTPNGVGSWEASETNRRDYFSKQFKKVKLKFNAHLRQTGSNFQLDNDHTIYSFRHTYITKLYRELRKEHSKTATHDQLMLITGHSSLDALKSYLRDIDAELPEDYSQYLN